MDDAEDRGHLYGFGDPTAKRSKLQDDHELGAATRLASSGLLLSWLRYVVAAVAIVWVIVWVIGFVNLLTNWWTLIDRFWRNALCLRILIGSSWLFQWLGLGSGDCGATGEGCGQCQGAESIGGVADTRSSWPSHTCGTAWWNCQLKADLVEFPVYWSWSC